MPKTASSSKGDDDSRHGKAKPAEAVSPEVSAALSKADEYARLAASASTLEEQSRDEPMQGKWLGIADGWKVIDSIDKL
jgi:hypothetical protein